VLFQDWTSKRSVFQFRTAFLPCFSCIITKTTKEQRKKWGGKSNKETVEKSAASGAPPSVFWTTFSSTSLPEILPFQSLQSSCCRGKITEVKFKMKQELETNIELLRSANLENCLSTYTPLRLSRYHQALYVWHTNQYLIQNLQQHAISHRPGQLAASSLLRRLLVETGKQDIPAIRTMQLN